MDVLLASVIADQPREAVGLLKGRSSEAVVVTIAAICGSIQCTRQTGRDGRAHQLVDQRNDYRSDMVTAVRNEGGAIDKVIGSPDLFRQRIQLGIASREARISTQASLQIRCSA